jgi:thymidylate kinase
MRGKIVLYDRYYFDFMADARRSNINLPKSVAESGYFFLMKPKFNFFLYASPEKILSRKEELSYQSISYLNTEYNKLFSKLGKHNNNAKYIAIENNNLNDTLDIIMNSIISAK